MRRNIVFAFCMIIMLFNKGDTYSFTEIKFNNGYGVLFDNGRLLTALHLVNDENTLLYCDEENDIAVVDLSEKAEISDTKNKKTFYNRGVKNSVNYLLYIDWLIDKGDSGKAYTANGKLLGIFIGRKGDKAVAAVISDKVFEIIAGGDENVA